MEILSLLGSGFAIALTPANLFYCFVGSLVGTAIGVLPGLGPPATIALLLPVTYGIPATSAVILLAGIFYGAMYGGSTTSILLNIPGEAASVVTCLDGYQMAPRDGRAPRWPSPPSARSSQARSAWSGSCCWRRRWPASR